MSAISTKRRTLVVIGATGHQGNAVLRYFASQPTQHFDQLRGLTRNVDSTGSKELQSLGVEMVQADLGDLAALRAALSGATHVFANTDSNQHIHDALKHPEKLAEGQTPAEYGTGIERNLGRNIAEAVASTESLERMVWSSLPSPKVLSKGRYIHVAMWDVKEEIARMLQAKDELKGKLSMLWVGFYAENALKAPAQFGPRKLQDGTYELSLPMSGDIALPLADVDSDAGRWVAALFQAPAGITMVGATEDITWNQWLALWGKHNGVKTRYHQMPDDELAKDTPTIRDAFLEMWQYTRTFGFIADRTDLVYPHDLRQMGISIQDSTIADHIRRSDWSSLL